MTYFGYRDGVLHAEDVALDRLAHRVGTPFYCYSQAAIAANYRAFAGAFEGMDAEICYAVKANSSVAVIRALAGLGAGADIVSEGEGRRALKAGVPPERIVFSGVGKSRAEMRFALAAGVGQFNVESIPELRALSETADEMSRTAKVALRVNPNVDAKTHEKITTGKTENKFGIDFPVVPEIYALGDDLPGIEMVGLAVHIGSQLTSLDPFRAAFERVKGLVLSLRQAGLTVSRLDLGGGLGIVYDSEEPPEARDYARMVRETVGELGCSLVFEPGRLIVGNAGILVTRVLYEKEGSARRFVIVDAAMNDLIRPTLYQAYHEIRSVREQPPGTPTSPADLVGPICETGDVLASQRALPRLREGDLLAILSAGAYGAVMASGYNSRLIAPEIMVNGGQFAVIRARESYDKVIALDMIPDWLAGS